MNRPDRSYFRLLGTVILAWCMLIATAHAQTAAPRAVWIWEEDAFRMLDSDTAREEAASFLERQHIAMIYLYADEFKGRNILVNEPERYRTLIAKAHARGFRVYALLGSAPLHTEAYILPEKRPTALRMFERVLEFNKNTKDASSRFDGVNIDIEPYLLDDWSSRRTDRCRQYLDLSAGFMRMKAAYGSSMLVGPAMPFWYDGIDAIEWNGRLRRMSEHVQDIYDYVSIMDYRNRAEGPDGIVSHAEDELAHADRTGKKVWIGVETLDTTPAKVTFFGTGESYFESQLAAAEAAMKRHVSFGGFVVHHLRSYRELVGHRK